ncbi:MULTISPECIES: DUF4179 domain-containing protein [unclassified Paenibacillus]|uniref:DUF4179 domain-containing protein n=1 Tax=unclassified Paenibacillus TaxID=185978 RepID=UPI003644D49D
MNPVNLDAELLKVMEEHPADLPDAVRKRIDATLSALPDKLDKRSRRLRHVLSVGSAAAVVMIGVIIGSAFLSPEMAAALRQVPGIESVFKLAGDFGLKIADEKGMVTEVNQAVTDQGITIKVSEVMYDDSRLTIGYVQQAPNGIMELNNVAFEINGKPVHYPSSGSGSRIDEHTYAGVINVSPEDELPGNFELTMTVLTIGNIEGKWTFQFPVKKMASNNKAVMPMVTKTHGDITLTVKKIIFTPSSTELDVKIKQPVKSEKFINYDIIDDKGIVLERFGGSGGGYTEGEYIVMDYKQRFGPAAGIPGYVTVRPVDEQQVAAPLKENRIPLDRSPDPELPIVLPQGDIGHLLVTKVELLNDKTKVHYRAVGVQPHLQGTQLWIEDEAGQKYLLLDKPTEVVDPIQYSFVREFPAFLPKQKLTLVTRELPLPDYTKELEMTIPVNR